MSNMIIKMQIWKNNSVGLASRGQLQRAATLQILSFENRSIQNIQSLGVKGLLFCKFCYRLTQIGMKKTNKQLGSIMDSPVI